MKFIIFICRNLFMKYRNRYYNLAKWELCIGICYDDYNEENID